MICIRLIRLLRTTLLSCKSLVPPRQSETLDPRAAARLLWRYITRVPVWDTEINVESPMFLA